MSEVKALLKELQAADLELRQITQQRDDIPKKTSELKSEIERIIRAYEDLKARLTDSRKEQKFAELNLSTQEEAVVKYNSQLYSAKTNEEYKAFLREIETSERLKREAEDKIIEIMERIETQETELAHEETSHKESITQIETQIVEIEQSKGKIEERITILEEKRARLRGEIPKDVLAVYDRIAKGKGNIAVVQVLEDNRCSGCLNPIPAQEAIETLHSDKLFLCQYCGRILVG